MDPVIDRTVPVPQPDATEFLITDHLALSRQFKAYEKLGKRTYVAKRELADEICNAILVHSQIEEEIFYPAARRAIDDPDLIDEATVEHEAAGELVTQIQALDVRDRLFDARVAVLREQFDHHVKEEQRTLFPKVRRSGVDLSRLGAALAQRSFELREARGMTTVDKALEFVVGLMVQE